jgi:hypothetical protein
MSMTGETAGGSDIDERDWSAGDQSLSLCEAQRQSGILVHVHPVLRESLKLRQLQLPRLGPDEQPDETSHLGQLRGVSQAAGQLIAV